MAPNKFKKFTRRTDRFDDVILDEDGNEISMWSEEAQRQLANGLQSGEDSAPSGSEADPQPPTSLPPSGGALPPPTEAQGPPMGRNERKALKKARKEAALRKAAERSVQVGDLPPSDSESEVEAPQPGPATGSSQTRGQASLLSADEELDRQFSRMTVGTGKAKKDPRAEIKSEQMKADLERLRVIRERREAEAARKQVRVAVSG